MLNYEQSSAELKKALVPWKPTFTARVSNTSPEVSAQIQQLELYATKHFDWRSPKLPQDFPTPLELFGQLDGLSLESRLELFAVFFPKFPGEVEATWQMFKTLPYQSGYSRRSFRALNHPQTLEQAGNWLLNMWYHTRENPEDLERFAVWNAYLHNENLGYLLAATVSAGNTRMLELLKEIASGDHSIGAVGRYITRALLTCSNPDAWDFSEKFLLAAQRQEGLRQTILEAVDEAHPEAFRRMLRLIKSENLYRFSAVTRAAAVWLGLNVDVTDLKMIGRYLSQLLEFLDAPETRAAALEGANAEDVYLALWASAFRNALETIPLAAKLLEHSSEQHRYVAATLLLALQLPEADAHKAQILRDPDLRIAALAIGHGFQGLSTLENAFELLEELAERSPKESVKKPIVWDWTGNIETKQNIVNLLPYQLLERPLERLLPYLPTMTTYAREHSVGLMAERAKTQPLNTSLRECVLTLVGDIGAGVRQKAIEVCKTFTLEPSEIQELEGFLVRKAGDLRRAILTLLSHQDGPQALESAVRLTASRKTELRQAGLEVLLELKKRRLLPPEGRELARSLTLSSAGELLLQEQVLSEAEEATLEDGLGLFDPAKLAKLPELQARALAAGNISVKLLTALDELIHQHRETPIPV
ncbi:MAG: hypothetical protein H7095_02620, partial [Pseudopedobacter sp.]|nr:hypothetical protein [Deinococcales bacterium]